jgi:putative tryptophan/tyrosine transport system substrate-binding protein
MRRREFITLVGGAAATWPCAVWGQQTGKVPSIGFLAPGASATSAPTLPFVDGLRQLGWIEDKTVTIEYRYAENRPERLAELAAELVRRKVDVIVAAGTPGPLAAKQATTTIPIVMTAAGDPVGTGLVASLAHPGGNVTGLSLMAPDLAGKRLELLKEIVPDLARVAIIWNASNPYPALVFKETEDAARRLKIETQSLEVRTPDDVGKALEAAVQGKANALIVVDDPLIVSQRKPIADFAAKNRLPTIYGIREFVDAGGFISYGAHLADLYRRAAGYVDKILKGAKPSDLPVEQPAKFELVINLKAAKMLGITIPGTMLARADEVIE